MVKAMRREQDHMKSDERILGDGEFTQSFLEAAKERLEERTRAGMELWQTSAHG